MQRTADLPIRDARNDQPRDINFPRGKAASVDHVLASRSLREIVGGGRAAGARNGRSARVRRLPKAVEAAKNG
jgi:hypothetical protein